MSSSPSPDDGLDPGALWESPAVFLSTWMVLVACQFYAGSFHAGFNGYPDEAGHVVSGVMLREYYAQGRPAPPFEFAANYYAHYPKVVIGHWPPVFYVAQAVWTGLFGHGKVPLFLMLSALSALTAVLVYRFVRPRAGRLAGACAALLWCLAPKTVFTTTTVLAEPLLTLLTTTAVLAYAAYLEKPRWSVSLLFGILAAAALLTKGSAIALALVPPAAVVLLRRPRLLLRLHFWAPAVVVVALAGLWYVPLLSSTAERVTAERTMLPALDRLALWIPLLGVPLLVAGVVGWAANVVRPALQGKVTVGDATFGAFVASAALFHQFVPESQEARHLVPASPFLIALAVLWFHAAVSRAPKPAALLAVFTLTCAAASFEINRKPATPYPRIAQDLLTDRTLDDAAILVSSEEYVEGALIAELALQAPRPVHLVLRASKQLARTDWNAAGPYELRYSDADLIPRGLLPIPAAVVVLEDAEKPTKTIPHHRQLRAAVAAESSPWKLQKRYPGSPGVAVYRLQAEDLARRTAIQVEIGRGGRMVDVPAPEK